MPRAKAPPRSGRTARLPSLTSSPAAAARSERHDHQYLQSVGQQRVGQYLHDVVHRLHGRLLGHHRPAIEFVRSRHHQQPRRWIDQSRQLDQLVAVLRLRRQSHRHHPDLPAQRRLHAGVLQQLQLLRLGLLGQPFQWAEPDAPDIGMGHRCSRQRQQHRSLRLRLERNRPVLQATSRRELPAGADGPGLPGPNGPRARARACSCSSSAARPARLSTLAPRCRSASTRAMGGSSTSRSLLAETSGRPTTSPARRAPGRSPRAAPRAGHAADQQSADPGNHDRRTGLLVPDRPVGQLGRP